MTILFGNLVNQFVNFQIIINEIEGNNATAAAMAEAELPAVASAFRHQAGLLATYLVVIGTSTCNATCAALIAIRRRHVPLHLHIYVNALLDFEPISKLINFAFCPTGTFSSTPAK